MTSANTGPEKHCGHECVCNWLACHIHCDELDRPCWRNGCENDTRQRKRAEGEPNPDMKYSALERLDIKFSELIGAIDEKQVDGQLSNKDHGDYEMVCYCRGFIRKELEMERRSHPLSDMCMEQNGARRHNQNDEAVFTYDEVTDAICFFHANKRVPTISEMRGREATPSICDKCTSGTGPYCQGCHTLHQLPQHAPWPELRMIEALEHVASTESWTAMNAYIAECRKQAEERGKENQNGKTH